MNTEKQLTPSESLEVITSMIRQAKGNFRDSSFYFLLWGWTIVIANLTVYFLINYTSVTNPFLVFGITIPAAIVSAIYGMRQGKRSTSSNVLNDVNQWLWTGFGITCFIFAIFGQRIGWQINPVIITMCATPTFVTGILIRFKPLIYGGIVFWVLGIVSFIIEPNLQFLVASLAVVLGYIVPGHMLKAQK